MDNDISWAWALQDEMPPPSAIVGRRDTVSVCYSLMYSLDTDSICAPSVASDGSSSYG
jgi:hypothetical protein